MTDGPGRVLRAATRGSALARWQTDHVGELLERLGVGVEPLIVSTVGDRDKTSPLHTIGGKGVFVKEVQAALLDGRADIAVHSAKDLPAITPDGLVIAAVPDRANPRDALVGTALADLTAASTVGTGSIRRRVQLQQLVPGITVVELRGNIDTRLSRVGELDAIVMASAALQRLGRTPEVVDTLDVDVMVPQVGQGALAIECRADDHSTREALAAIEDPVSRRCFDAERAFLAELGGDCDLPAGAHAEIAGDLIDLRATLSDGQSQVLRRREAAENGVELGARLARELREALS